MDINRIHINEIKTNLKASIKKIGKILKDTLKLPYAKTYIASSFLLIIFFIIGTFPYDVIVRNQLQKANMGPVKNILVGKIDLNFFSESTISNLRINMRDGNEINLKNITANASLNPYTLFISKIYEADIQVKEMLYSSPEVNIDSLINSNIYIQYDPKTKITNKSYIKFIAQNINLRISEFNLPPNLGGMPVELPKMKITSINFDSNINNNVLRINRCKISGQHIRGSIKGTINFLVSSPGNSKLNLTIKIDSNSKIVAKYKEFITSYIDRKGNITFTLKGTFSRPRPEFRKKTIPSQSKVDNRLIPK